MNESSLNNNGNRDIESESIELLTPENTSKVSTLTELWSLAKMVKDVEGDSIWEVLFKTGCKPKPFCYGYMFDYKGLTGIYFAKRNSSETIRFAIPKLLDLDENSYDEIFSKVNVANSMISESKFTIMGKEVWLIHERFMSSNEDYRVVVEHILENLKCSVEQFHKIC